MKTKYNYNAESLLWGYSLLSNIRGDYDYKTTPCSIEATAPLARSKLPRKDWKVYKCKTCNFITHAISLKATKNKSRIIALVTNFKVTTTTTNAQHQK